VLIYHFLTDESLKSADKDQQEHRAVIEKLHDAVVKFRYVPKYTAASRCSRCDSMAFLYVLSLFSQFDLTCVHQSIHGWTVSSHFMSLLCNVHLSSLCNATLHTDTFTIPTVRFLKWKL